MSAIQTMPVRAFVFSPTGGTFNATYMLASMFSDAPQMIDQTDLATREAQYTLSSDELVLLAAPSFGGKVPYAPNLFTNLKGNDTPCILICTYGNRACENNLAQMYQTAIEQGFVVVGAITLVTPHTLAIRSGHSRPDLQDQQVMQKFARKVCDKLTAGTRTSIPAPEGDPTPSERKRAKTCIPKHLNKELCGRCGTCVTACPEGAINADTLEIDEDICIQCQRCSHICPTGARSYTANWDAIDAKCYAPRKDVSYLV